MPNPSAKRDLKDIYKKTPNPENGFQNIMAT